MFVWRPYLLSVLLGAACSGPHLKGDLYRGEGVAFRIGAIPRSWERLEVGGAKLAFRDAPGESTVLVNARCGRDGDDVPLVALTHHLFMLFTEREAIEQTLVSMDGREALHTILRAKLDGVPKMFDAFVLKKDGCVYDFVDVTSPETFEANRPVFEAFVAGFRTLRD